jgi:hypothetical protein
MRRLAVILVPAVLGGVLAGMHGLGAVTGGILSSILYMLIDLWFTVCLGWEAKK